MRKNGWVGLVLGAAVAACSAAEGGETTADAELNETKALGMTDVTILYPLPKSIEFFDDLLGPSSELEKGELLPPALFAQLAELPAPKMIGPNGQPVDPPQKKLFAEWQDSFSRMRVLGIRLDPCFGESTNLGAESCVSTIRLTAQFFLKEQASLPDGRSAVHLFYKLTREDFKALAKGMLQLRKDSGLPLQKGLVQAPNQGVHPTLALEGPRGAYATGLKNLILTYAGERTLTRIAFSVQDRGPTLQSGGYGREQNPDNRWVFGGFEYKAGTLQPLPIASLNYTGLQAVDTQRSAERPTVVVTPAIEVPDNFLESFNQTRGADGQVDAAKIEKARKASLNLQNPSKYTTANSDCVSCHMAKQAAPQHAADELDFKSPTFRLDHSHDALGPFRLFGYDLNGQPVVARRVVNETVVVLDYLNRNVMQ